MIVAIANCERSATYIVWVQCSPHLDKHSISDVDHSSFDTILDVGICQILPPAIRDFASPTFVRPYVIRSVSFLQVRYVQKLRVASLKKCNAQWKVDTHDPVFRCARKEALQDVRNHAQHPIDVQCRDGADRERHISNAQKRQISSRDEKSNSSK